MLADALPSAGFRFVAEGVSSSALPADSVARFLTMLAARLGEQRQKLVASPG